MPSREVTKVVSVRIPAIFFKRLGFLAYNTGRLPSEVARQILIDYLNIGCQACGGPLYDVDFEDRSGICPYPPCAEGSRLANVTAISDYSNFPNLQRLPGFGDQ